MSTALLTGGTGFVGSHLLQGLLDENWTVLAIKRASSELPQVESDRLHWFDMEDRRAVELLFGEHAIDAVFHLATAYGRAEESTRSLVESNLLFPLDLLELAVRAKVGSFLFTDTCFTVDYPYLQRYTLSKKQFADWGKVLTTGTQTRFVNLELQHPFGPRDRSGKFVPWIIEQCLKAHVKIPLTNGLQCKDFIYVEDVVSACLTVIQSAEQLSPGYHLIPCGRGVSVALKEFVETVHRVCKSSAILEFGALAGRPQEVMFSVADTTILSGLGWKPMWDLEGGVEQTVAFYRQLLGENN